MYHWFVSFIRMRIRICSALNALVLNKLERIKTFLLLLLFAQRWYFSILLWCPALSLRRALLLSDTTVLKVAEKNLNSNVGHYAEPCDLMNTLEYHWNALSEETCKTYVPLFHRVLLKKQKVSPFFEFFFFLSFLNTFKIISVPYRVQRLLTRYLDRRAKGAKTSARSHGSSWHS